MSDKDEGSQTAKKSYFSWLMLVIGVICVSIILTVWIIYKRNQNAFEGEVQNTTTGLAQKETKKEKKSLQQDNNNKNNNENGLFGNSNINSPFNLIEKPVTA